MTRRIWRRAPRALADAALFNAAEIEAYEQEILDNPRATEHDASRFFQQHPKFLYLGTGAEVRREVVLLGTNQRVDFFRRPYGEIFWDIIELKSPRKPIISGIQTLHPHLSSDVRNAIDQAIDYSGLIEKDERIRLDLKNKGIRVCRAQIIVIVGQNRGEVDAETLRILYDRARRSGAVDPRSYTDVYKFAKEHYARFKTIALPSRYIEELPRQSIGGMSGRVFGEIPGISVGTLFTDRTTLNRSGIHRPLQGGISGSADGGADSIVLAGNYEDDCDFGDTIIYTGLGRQDPVSRKQVADQTLTRQNLALAVSMQQGLPVRVVRGSTYRSPFSPPRGYRYDGLFTVESFWHEKGAAGFTVWRFRLTQRVT